MSAIRFRAVGPAVGCLVFVMLTSSLVMGARPAAAADAVPLIGPAEGADLHVMTWNLRKPIDPSPYTWEERRPRVAVVLAAEQPTILAVQEVTRSMLDDVSAMLPDSYAWIGRSPAANPGPGDGWNVIFYDTSRVQPFDHRHVWLSETPTVPGSVSWGSTRPRLMTWVKFDNLVTGGRLLVFNAHFDHVSALARRKSAEKVMRNVDRMGRNKPATVMCDCNAKEGDSDAWRIIRQKNLGNSWNTAAERLTPAYGTFNHWADPVIGARRIDWILRTGDAEVDAIAINPTKYLDDFPSDHLPVHARLKVA